MCILCVKRSGIKVPADSVFEECFSVNRDGAGLCWADGEKVNIVKGLMNIGSFKNALRIVEELIDTEKSAMLFHFRIGTHGSKNSPAHTHPFPIVDDYPEMEKLVYSSEQALAHNGILHIGKIVGDTARTYNSEVTGPSDTMELIANVVRPFSKLNENWADDKKLSSLFSGVIDTNKIAIIRKDGVIYTFGSFIEDDGMIYSNSSYKTYKAPAYTDTYLSNWNKAAVDRDKDTDPDWVKGYGEGYQYDKYISAYFYADSDGLYRYHYHTKVERENHFRILAEKTEKAEKEKATTDNKVIPINKDKKNRVMTKKEERELANDLKRYQISLYLSEYQRAANARESRIGRVLIGADAMARDDMIASGYYTFYKPTTVRVKERLSDKDCIVVDILNPDDPWYMSNDESMLFYVNPKTGNSRFYGYIVGWHDRKWLDKVIGTKDDFRGAIEDGDGIETLIAE
jgi:hypothetical protein